jgi:hypothetical protein
MNRIVAFGMLLAACLSVSAQDLASCSNPSGHGYFPAVGIVGPEDSGWEEESITGGITKVVKVGDKDFDILFVDSRGEIISSRQDGGHILLLNQGAKVFSLLVVYPGKTAEVYTFLEDAAGELLYLMTTSRAGDGVGITKASVMRGDCSYIRFGDVAATGPGA